MRSGSRRGIITSMAAAVALAMVIGAAGPAAAAEKKSFKIAWSIYVGWMPWPYAQEIPGEIIDMMVVNTQTLKDNPKLAMALVGAWYEVLGMMQGSDAAAVAARTQLAKDSGTDIDGFDGQLKTTRMYYDPAEAAGFARGKELVKTMDLVRKFSFDHGLLGEGAKSVDALGMQFPGGEALGNPQNVKMRFNPDFMKMAADHKL
jgi:NitT/TauT family transport system substrate-binding protein